MSKFKKVVVVDDDPISLMICERIIRKYNFAEEVISFKEGKDAMEYVLNTKIKEKQLILLDINMPNYNGWNFLDDYEKIDEDIRANTTIAMLSSTFDPLDFTKADTYKTVDKFFTKPLTIENLAGLVNESLTNN